MKRRKYGFAMFRGLIAALADAPSQRPQEPRNRISEKAQIVLKATSLLKLGHCLGFRMFQVSDPLNSSRRFGRPCDSVSPSAAVLQAAAGPLLDARTLDTALNHKPVIISRLWLSKCHSQAKTDRRAEHFANGLQGTGLTLPSSLRLGPKFKLT